MGSWGVAMMESDLRPRSAGAYCRYTAKSDKPGFLF